MTLLAPLVPDGDRVLAEAIETAEPLLGTSRTRGSGRPLRRPRPTAVAARAGDPGARRGWSRQRRDRGRAGPEPADRGAPCVEHLPEAGPGGTDRPRRRSGVGASARGQHGRVTDGHYVSAATARPTRGERASFASRHRWRLAATSVRSVAKEVPHGPPRTGRRRDGLSAVIVLRLAQRGPRRSGRAASPTSARCTPARGWMLPTSSPSSTRIRASPSYGTIVHETPMPAVGDEFHHFGWNRCSSACHGPDRSHLIVPGFRSSRVYILDVAEDPRRPRLVKVIEPDELIAATGYSRPHTVHCMPGENIVISMLGDADGGGAGGFAVLDARTFEIKGRWNDGGPTPPFNYDFWYQPRLDTLVSSEFGEPNAYEPGFRPGRRPGRAVRPAAPLLEPVGPASGADDRSRRAGAGPARAPLAARPGRRPGLRRGRPVERGLAMAA